MKYTLLPETNIKISKICLGTMTFGEQNSETEAHSQIDFALDKGINFIDTAEMYPIAARKETYGATEKIIGSWLKKSNKRDTIVLASKIAGPNRGMAYIREDLGFSKNNIRLSIEQSLQRLQTEYIDLYQFHWPERKVNMFGERSYTIQEDSWEDNFQSILETLSQCIKEGKIRNFGVSNETPWGLMRFLEESKKHHLPKPITLQNPYSLLNRTFEIALSEVCHHEKVGLLAYSPLGFGALSAKFLHRKADPNSRLNLFPHFTRYTNDQCVQAIQLYNKIAVENGLTLSQMALAFVQQQNFVTSTIIGATTLQQLEENINTQNLILTDEIIKAINQVQVLIPNPAP